MALVMASACTKDNKAAENLIKLANDYKNTAYIIEGQKIQLKNGLAEVAASGAGQTAYQYFGNEVSGDFNGDGTADKAFLLSVNTGGSGTFYYIVAALKTEQGFIGTNAVFLGDRIAPQTSEFKDGKIIVNFAERKSGELMSASPSVGVSKYFKVANGELVEIK